MTSSPEGRQEAEVLDAKALRSAILVGSAECREYEIPEPHDGIYEVAIRAYLSALPAPVASVWPAVNDLQARLWNASGELAAHGGFDNHCRTLDEAAAALALIPAKPAMEVIEALRKLRKMTIDDAPYDDDEGAPDEEARLYKAGQIVGIAFACYRIDAALQVPATPDAQTEVEK